MFLVLASSRTAAAVVNFLTSGGRGRSAVGTSATSSTLNNGCHRVILSSGTSSGLSKVDRNFLKGRICTLKNVFQKFPSQK